MCALSCIVEHMTLYSRTKLLCMQDFVPTSGGLLSVYHGSYESDI